MITRGNALSGTYKNFIIRNLKQTISHIPPARRQSLAVEIEAAILKPESGVSFMECKDPDILRVALRHLRRDANE